MSFTVTTESFALTFDAATESDALDMYARECGYKTFADLADTLGKTQDEARAEITVRAAA